MVALPRPSGTKVRISSVSEATKSLLQRVFLGTEVTNNGLDHAGKVAKGFSRLNKRRDIIDQKLCDDAVQYLGPSLEQYRGATIIDINPGSCVWSQSLHRFLKPKRHLLLEPDAKYFDPFIKPLLEQHDSAYTFMPIAGAREREYFDNWKTILAGSDAMPARPPLLTGDPRLKQLDTSLLVTGNLWRLTQKSLRVKMASMIISQTAWGAHTNQLFHNAGRIRMLWWLPEGELRQLIAQDCMSRTALNAGLELTSDVNVVVGCTPLYEVNRGRGEVNQRGPQVAEAVAAKVRDRMAASGLHPPPGRKLLNASASGMQSLLETYPKPMETSCSAWEELEALVSQHEQKRDEAFKTVKRMKNVHSARFSRQDYIDAAKALVVYPQCVPEITSRPTRFYDNKANLILQVILSVDLGLQTVHLQCEWQQLSKRLPGDKVRSDALRDRIVLASRSWYNHKDSPASILCKMNMRSHASHLSLQHATPQPITHDNRSFEPLEATSQAFWPQGEMALLDVVPRDIDLGIEGVADAEEAVATCRELLKHLWFDRNLTMAQCLEHLAPNAREDFMPHLPELADPESGGDLVPAETKMQHVHRDTLIRLTHAFLEWPFRPESGQLAMLTEDAEQEAKMDAEQSATAKES